jgi:hypothetical protein
MGIRFYCPNGHKLNVKAFQAGRRGICPYCGVSMLIPTESTRPDTSQSPGSDNEPGVLSALPAAAQPVTQAQGLLSQQPAAQPGLRPAPQPIVPTKAAAVAPVSGNPAPMPTPMQPAPGTAAANWSAAPTPLEAPRPAAHPEPAPVAAAPASLHTDPFAEAPTAVWYVRPASGGQYGPATGDIMRAWLAEGRVGADSLVWREGWPEWLDAVRVFPQLKPDDMPLVVSGKAGKSSPVAAAPPPARRASRPTAVIITVLALAVVALLIVLLMILFQQPSVAPEQKAAPAAKTAAFALPSSQVFTRT